MRYDNGSPEIWFVIEPKQSRSVLCLSGLTSLIDCSTFFVGIVLVRSCRNSIGNTILSLTASSFDEIPVAPSMK